MIFCILLYTVLSLGVFNTLYTCLLWDHVAVSRQSGGLNFMFRENKGPIIYFAERKEHEKQHPLMSSILIQISVHAGKHMIIIVG